MIKKDIVSRLREKLNLSSEQSREAVEQIIKIMQETLLKKEPVEIRGFGAFVVKRKKKGKGRDFKRGVLVDVPSNYRVKFIPSKKLKKAI